MRARVVDVASDRRQQPGRDLRCIGITLAVAFTAAVVIGAIMSWIFFLRTFDPTFAALRSTDLRLGQRIYNETVARLLKVGYQNRRLNFSLARSLTHRTWP
jgi:hypothetical protein